MVSSPAGELPGGWTILPGGSFELDPTSKIKRIPSEGVSYDRAFDRWVPADWNHLSPDGRRFVVQAGGDSLDIVDVATGAGRTVTMPRTIGAWTAIDFTSAGIYVAQMGGMVATQPGLWVLDPDSGRLRQLDATQSWSQVDSRAAWGIAGVGDRAVLRRLDLKDGTVTDQLVVATHQPPQPGDRSLQLISLDASGRPLVLERDWQRPYPWHLAVLDAPNTLREVAVPRESVAGWPIADNGDPYQGWREVHEQLLSQGVWMFGRSSFSGLALLGPEGVTTQLTTGPEIFALAGGCH